MRIRLAFCRQSLKSPAATTGAPRLRRRIQLVSKCDIVIPGGLHGQPRLKFYDTTPAHVRASVQRSLALLGVERLDLLLIHRPDPLMDADATGAALDALVDEGLIAAAGVSNFLPHDFQLLASRMKHPLVTNQIELSLAARAPWTDGQLAFLQQQRIRPMAWSPLGGGRLFAAIGGALQGRLWPRNDEERQALVDTGYDVDRVLTHRIAYLLRTDGGWWALLMFAGLGWLTLRFG